MEQKNVREQNLFQLEQKLLLKEQKKFMNENRVQSENITSLHFSCRFLRLCGLLQISMGLYGLLWLFNGLVWPFHGPFMASYGKFSI